MKIPAYNFHYDAVYPSHKTEGAAGSDLEASIDVLIPSHKTESVPTGLSVAIPQGFFGMVTLRSSLGKDGLMIPNSPGIIDCDYRGEIKVLLHNLTNEPVIIYEGQRVAQLIIVPYEKVEYVDTEYHMLPETDRGTGGFGSTGK